MGLPVFQAVRPRSRALRVHQGKHRDPELAQIGALMEGVESHAAESFCGLRRSCRLIDLPDQERVPAADDFAKQRGGLDAQSLLDWTPLSRWRDGGVLWAPWLGISLDLTLDTTSPVERSSNGLAAGFDSGAVRLAALCEVLERDAMAEWLALAPARCALDRLDVTRVGAAWLQNLQAQAQTWGVRMTVFGFASLVGWPVVVCSLHERAAAHLRRGRVYGSACRPDAHGALEAAVAEAAQARLTAISAVRDDILPGEPFDREAAFVFAPPLPPTMTAADFDRFGQAARGPDNIEDAADLIERCGLGPVAEIELPAPAPARVFKVVAPGLGMEGRRRRSAA